jgi:hypothetical protein
MEDKDKKNTFLLGFIGGMLHTLETAEVMSKEGGKTEEEIATYLLDLYEGCSGHPTLAILLAKEVFEPYYYKTVGKDEVQ